MKELEFKIENIGNETIIYYVDTMEIKSNHLVICNKISENIYNNIRYIEYHNDIYKSRCDFHLRLELTLEEIKNHIITQCVCLITKNYLEDNAGYKERHYISLNKLNSLINFLNKTPTEKEIIYILHDEYNTINAPMVGTFYKSPSPDEEAYVQVGDKVTNESTVCILEAMKLFNEIQAETTGEIIEILVEDGQMVEYGQPLFKVK